MAFEFIHPIIGQEAICPDGLGRVIAYKDSFPDQWVQVQTYVNDRGCEWSPGNIELVLNGSSQKCCGGEGINMELAHNAQLDIMQDALRAANDQFTQMARMFSEDVDLKAAHTKIQIALDVSIHI